MTSRLPNANTKMFLLHAFYGLGATVSPLVSTEFVKREPSRVYLYFVVSLGLGVATVVALLSVFRLRTEDQIVGQRLEPPETIPLESLGDPEGRDETLVNRKEQDEGSGSKFKRILRTPAVHFMAFYLAIYVSGQSVSGTFG